MKLYCDICQKGRELIHCDLDGYELECGHKMKVFSALPDIDENIARFIGRRYESSKSREQTLKSRTQRKRCYHGNMG